ncbi:hypothetical protein AB0I50_41565, partial [Streptomyces prunicolor]
MQMNTPPRSTIRLTRRGRVALIATGAVVAGTAVAVPLLSLESEGDARPTSLVIPEGWRDDPGQHRHRDDDREAQLREIAREVVVKGVDT